MIKSGLNRFFLLHLSYSLKPILFLRLAIIFTLHIIEITYYSNYYYDNI